MLAQFGMLAFLGSAATWKGLTFWSPENLIATLFHGDAALRPGFTTKTIAGLALYLMIYSLLGALFAVAAHRRLAVRYFLPAGILFGVAWYFLLFRLLYPALIPTAALLHAEGTTMIGHVLYGALLSAFPRYLCRSQLGGMVDLAEVVQEPAPVLPEGASGAPKG
jgi:hypothetical protein